MTSIGENQTDHDSAQAETAHGHDQRLINHLEARLWVHSQKHLLSKRKEAIQSFIASRPHPLEPEEMLDDQEKTKSSAAIRAQGSSDSNNDRWCNGPNLPNSDSCLAGSRSQEHSTFDHDEEDLLFKAESSLDSVGAENTRISMVSIEQTP